MARGDQLARQWKIIQALIAGRRGRSVPELAELVECHTRTVYRDLEALQAAGFPVTTEKDGHRTVWLLLDPSRQSIPIAFNLSELMALYFGRGMVRSLKGTVFYDALNSLCGKIKATLPPDAGDFLERIEAGVSAAPAPRGDYGKLSGIIDTINEAMGRQRFIEMVYRSMSRGQETRRKVAPYRLLFFDGTFYLIANCGLRKDIRMFALERIRRVRITERVFDPPDARSLEALLSSSFGVFQGPRTRVAVRFAPEVAAYIAEKIWHPSQKLGSTADGSLVLEVEVAGTEEIKRWILSWGSKAVVLAPESLQNDMRMEAERMAGEYGALPG